MAAAGDEGALARLGSPAPRELPIAAEPPELSARTLSLAARLLAGATTFFFMAFVFAYFYLRAINQNHMWRPAHVKPEQGWGVVFLLCIVLSMLLAILAGRAMKRSAPGWVVLATGAIVLGLAAIVVRCIEFTVQKFGPTDGAYASVFCIWLAFYLIAVLCTMYWLETQVATEFRARRAPAGSEGDVRDPDQLIAPGLNAAVFYWGFLGAIGVLTYVVLYPLQ